MKISDMNWMQVECYLQTDDRAVLPIGSTEQHAYLSLCTDNIEVERVAIEGAEPLGVPVFPTLTYGVAPYWLAFPGSVSLRVQTLIEVIRDIMNSLHGAGFRRILVVNGHGGNDPVRGFVREWTASKPDAAVKFHNWWQGIGVRGALKEIGEEAGHASWLENFPWTRLPEVESPQQSKPMIDNERFAVMNAAQVRSYVGDGNCGGPYKMSEAATDTLWKAAVIDVRACIEGPWE